MIYSFKDLANTMNVLLATPHSARFCTAILIGAVVAGCATAGFARFKGRALRLDVAIYQGTPPPEYHYKSLGQVEGFYPNNFFDMKMMTVARTFAALEDMANRAKAMSANAVINTQLVQSNSKGFRYQGEAVVFEMLPDARAAS